MADIYERVYNPDVLSCLANLSNDEVFTPPETANQVLDMLPEELWSDPDAKFLDPCSKTGVFLREIAKRLIRGQVPDFDERMLVIDAKRAEQEDLDEDDEAFLDRLQGVLDHIFKEQLYGIGITELTSLMTRRSLYCSKGASTKYAVVTFDDDDGNIRYRNIQHTWEGSGDKKRCKFCGASKKELEENRTSSETHAYELIHTTSPERIFDMNFDVIIGNPPYQMSDGGNNASAVPIYQKFVEQAMKLNPRYLAMITPSRWFSGGRGLDKYRADMLNDRRLRRIVDYENAGECFAGIDMSGGVSYFLWDRDYDGDCTVVNMKNGVADEQVRDLRKHDILIRSNQAVSVVDKVASAGYAFMSDTVSSQKPFGLRTFVQPSKKGELVLRWRNGKGPIERQAVTAGLDMIDKWKVIVSRVVYEHAGGTDAQGMRRVLSILETLAPGEVCTETYIVVEAFDTEEEAKNCMSYLELKLPRFLISQVASAQMVNKKSFAFVPRVDFGKSWTDEGLYNEFGLTDSEAEYVESCIKPMRSEDSDA